jgi:hypothetical protein
MKFTSPKSLRDENFNHLHGGTIKGGTFSKANGPRTIRDITGSAKGSFFQRVMEENNQNNKDMNMSTRSKKASNMSFSSI